jgi:hypothetical protein
MVAGVQGRRRPWISAFSLAVPVVAALGLGVHARSFDFVCDDAFIALREAQNLVQHGAPVYNLGERVEAATSPGWVVLLALGLLVRAPPVTLLKGLSLASGVLLVAATWALARRFLPARPFAQAFVLGALALSAPVAAWAGGGLETCLFAAGVTFAFARLHVVDAERTSSTAIELGLVLGATCFVRLEGLLLVVVSAWALRAVGRPLLVRMLGVALGPVALLTLFRLGYYGLPLPHTFYAKTGDVRVALAAHGLAYARFFFVELGVGESLLLFVSPFVLASSPTVRAVRLFVPLSVLYVVVVGGDFLDLFRFFVPLLPVLFVSVGAVAVGFLDRYPSAPALPAVVGLLMLGAHGARQLALSARSLAVSDVRRLELGIEPLGWTKQATRDWSRTGMWLASVAAPGDTLATSAAGALPFFSGLPNYDLLGLAAPDVARDGSPLWVRPGHTRFATSAQIERRAPTFLQLASNEPWETRGYRRVDIHVAADLTVQLFVRRERAATLLSRADVTAVAAP